MLPLLMRTTHFHPTAQRDIPSALEPNKVSGTVRALANAEMHFSQKRKWGYEPTNKENKKGKKTFRRATQITSVSRNSGRTLVYLE